MSPARILNVGMALIWAEIGAGYFGLPLHYILIGAIPIGFFAANLARRIPWMGHKQPFFPEPEDDRSQER